MKKYDYIFCGVGASASLLFLNLFKDGLLKDKKVLLIDQEQKTNRDKTFCFWSTDDEKIGIELKSIISNSWDKIELPNSEIISLLPFRYNHVSSIDLYKSVNEISDSINCEKIISKVDNISFDEDSSYVLIGDNKLRGVKIFDSRTPAYFEASTGEIHIYQSFVGWIVEVREEFKNPDAFRFMDFNIEQQGFTQFVYVLPFSNKKALIEVTRFGSEIINVNEAEVLLQEYIENQYGKFTKLETEQGSIPMSNAQIKNDILPEVTYLGSRNYNIKASTGYAFKNMFYHGKKLAESIKKGESTEVHNINKSNVFNDRFTFYDGLLLDILKNRPNQGQQIFILLLKKVKIQNILKFLDEKTDLKEDISIFAQLPWKPFIAAIVRKPKFQFFLRPLLLLFVSIILLFLGNGTSAQSILGYTLFLIGMFMVGLPHGALDHLLETGNWSFTNLPKFILKYLSLSALMGCIWLFFPPLALGIFLVYSAWHFGQADGKQWGLPHIVSFLWGISLLYYLLGTHSVETNIILSSMVDSKLPLDCPFWSLFPWLLLALYKKNIPFVITILWLTIISFLPLIFAFGIYFIGQHSINGWIEIKSKLNLSNKSIWLHALPFHLAAWLLMVIYYLIFLNQNQDKTVFQWGVFFIFLSCISLPHIIAMNPLYFKKNDN